MYSRPKTTIDPRLTTTFKLRNWPGRLFRIHPQTDGLICSDGEVFTQCESDGEWLYFVRCQQSEVLAQFIAVDPMEGYHDRNPEDDCFPGCRAASHG